MSNELRAMRKTHLAIDHSMDVIIDLIAEIEEGSKLDSVGRRALKAHTQLLKKLVAQHLEREEKAASSAERWLTEKPEEIKKLHLDIHRMYEGLKNFSKSVEDLDDGIELSDEAWRKTRANLAGLVDTFRQCADQEWEFYTLYSTLLEPGGVSS